MDPATPPELSPEPKPSFALPPWAWLAWGLYAAACVGGFIAGLQHSGASEDTAFQLGELVGQSVAMLLLPAAFAWFVWRIGGRAHRGGRITFGVVFALLVLGQFTQFLARAQAMAKMNALQAEDQRVRAEQRAAVARGEPIDDKGAEDVARRASEQLGEMARNSSGRNRVVAEAMQAYMQEMLKAKEPYDRATAAISAGEIWTLKDLNTPAAIAAFRQHVKDFAAANQALALFQDRNATALRRELAKRKVSTADADRAVAGYLKGAAGRLEPMTKVRETDGQLADAMLKMLDLAQANLGRWKTAAGSGQLAFNDAAAGKAYREIIARVQTIAAEQAKAQQDLLAPRN